jgi:hypothetical protein
MGCAGAHHVARQVILHGSSGDRNLPCTSSGLPHNVTLWTCHGSEHGHKSRVEFGIRATLHPAPVPTAPVVTCSSIVYAGYRAQNIREQGLGCDPAHALARNLILHGGSHHRNITCTRSYHRGTASWSCAGQVHEHGVRLTFYLVQVDPNVA